MSPTGCDAIWAFVKELIREHKETSPDGRRATYLALDRPELSFAAKELCRRMSSPRTVDLQLLRRVCRYLRGAPRVVYEFPWQPQGGWGHFFLSLG